ncbi:unnamed protein product, partial [Rotaria sordida]
NRSRIEAIIIGSPELEIISYKNDRKLPLTTERCA